MKEEIERLVKAAINECNKDAVEYWAVIKKCKDAVDQCKNNLVDEKVQKIELKFDLLFNPLTGGIDVA